MTGRLMKYQLLAFLTSSIISIAVLADDQASTFQNEILTIPRVDTQDQSGKYQDVQFKVAADGRWDIINYKETSLATINKLEISTELVFPIKISVVASGDLPSDCYQLGQIITHREDSKFIVTVSQKQVETFAPCTQVLVPFKTTIPLDVTELKKGSYQILVNGKNASFELNTDNFQKLN